MPKKKLKRLTFWSRPVLYVTRETFLVQFPGPTGAIYNFVGLLIELFWSLQVYRKKFKEIKKTLTESHDYSRLFSLKKGLLKTG